MTTRCEDYPCCGHTPEDPCGRQWYDEPGAFDTRLNPHALCEHEYGLCDVWEDDEELPEHRYNPAPFCGKCGGPCEMEDDEPMMEDQWLDGSYEE